MILTNKHNLPPHLYKKILDDLRFLPYDVTNCPHQWFRTTELVGAPRVVTLHRRYFQVIKPYYEATEGDVDDLQVDASHYLTVQLGKAIHSVLEGDNENGQDEFTMFEVPVQRDVEYKGQTYRIFGTIDELTLHKDTLILDVVDNKSCLTKNWPYDVDNGYKEQTNIYMWILEDIPEFKEVTATNIKLRYILKDFTAIQKVKVMARSNPHSQAYKDAMALPDCMIGYKDVEVLSPKQRQQLVLGKLADQIENPERLCTPDERFDVRRESYAVMLTGNKSAKRVLDTKDAANAYINGELTAKDKKRASIEVRKAERWECDKKCQYYCEVAGKCPYAASQGYVK
jgi:hypothetical protein